MEEGKNKSRRKKKKSPRKEKAEQKSTVAWEDTNILSRRKIWKKPRTKGSIRKFGEAVEKVQELKQRLGMHGTQG